MSQEIVLEGCIISYPKIFVPEQIDGAGDPKHQAQLILPANAPWDILNACVAEAIASKFGATPPAGLKMPWKDATEKGFPGQFLVSAYSDASSPPQVTDQAVQPLMDRGKIFSGCIVNAYVRFYGYKQQGGGVTLWLNAIQIVDNVNVTRLDNTKAAKDVFQPIAGAPPATAVMPPAAATGYAPPAAVPPVGYAQPGIPATAPQPAATGYAPPQPGVPPQPGIPATAPQPGAPVGPGPAAWNQ